jgi:hypothetical protein
VITTNRTPITDDYIRATGDLIRVTDLRTETNAQIPGTNGRTPETHDPTLVTDMVAPIVIIGIIAAIEAAKNANVTVTIVVTEKVAKTETVETTAVYGATKSTLQISHPILRLTLHLARPR